MSYRVVAPYVTIRVPDAAGKWQLRGFHVDAVLPAGALQDDLDRHVRKGMIEVVPEPDPEPAKTRTTKAAG